MIRTRILCVAALIGPLTSLSAQDVSEILRGVQRRHAEPKSFEFEIEHVKMDPHAAAPSQTTHARIAIQKPDLLRMEGQFGELLDEWELPEVTIAVDGRSTWVYSAAAKQYILDPDAPVHADPTGTKHAIRKGEAEDMVDHVEKLFLERIRRLAFSNRARFVRAESIQLNGKVIPCWVVHINSRREAGQPSRHVWWIDQATSILLREEGWYDDPKYSSQLSSTTYRVAKIDEPLPKSLFKFTPPRDAQRVDQIDYDEKP